MNATQFLEMKASSAGMTPAQAAEFIRSCDRFRTLREKMEKFAGEGDLRSRLLAGLSLYHPELRPGSLDRKVRMWLNGQTDLTLGRETIIELAFLFGFTVEQADSFLALMTDEGFRWRDPEEIVMIFALGRGMEYPEAEALRRELGGVKTSADRDPAPAENLTDLVREEVLQLTTVEALRDYLTENAPRLGKCRNRAWQMYMKFMDRLRQPDLDENVRGMIDRDHLEAESVLSTLAVLKAYLHRDPIPQGDLRSEMLSAPQLDGGRRAVLSSVLSAWPEESQLLKMQKRQIPVGRKVLILLFLALDEDPYDEYDDDEDDRDPAEAAAERFESRLSRINLMLGSCGFRLLDPRNPFDWIILYTISVEDLFDSDGRMDELLTELFSGSGI